MAKADVKNMDFFEKTGYVFSLIKPSWEAFVLNWTTFVLLWILPLLLVLAISPFIAATFISDSGVISTFSFIIIWLGLLGVFIVTLLLWPATIITQIASVKNQKMSLGQALSSSKDIIFKFIGVALIILLIIALPFLIVIPLIFLVVGLFLIPFVFVWALVVPFFLSLAPYLVVYEKAGPVEAIKRSFSLVKQHWQWVLAVVVVLLAINIATSAISWVPFIGFIAGVALSIAYACMPTYVFVHHIMDTNSAKATAKSAASPLTVKKTSPNKSKVSKPAKKSNK